MYIYHEETVYQRGSLLGHSLDWANRPLTIKAYKNRKTQPLPMPAPCQAAFFDVSLNWPPRFGRMAQVMPNAAILSQVLNMSAGVTSPRWEDGEMLGLRAPASAGGLYPSELYVIASEVNGVENGLYHFSPQGVNGAPAEEGGAVRAGWHFLWKENLAGWAASALGGRAGRLSFFISSILWRSLWKYSSRAYRYCLLDAGHLLANLELALAGFGLLPRTNINFADNSASVLLGLADQDEVPLVAVRAGGMPEDFGADDIDLPPLDLQAAPLSQRIGRDFGVLGFHQASKLNAPRPEPVWQGPTLKPGGEHLPLPKPKKGGPRLDETMYKRRSQRGFSGKPLSAQAISQIMSAMLPAQSPIMATLVLGAGNEVAGGTHLYLPVRNQLMPRSAGQDWRMVVAEACLGQSFIGKASAQIILWADLHGLEQKLGARAYRQAMLAAGRAGQRCYLACQALRLNCCGIGAFYDDDLAAVNGMPERAQPLYVLAVG